MKFPEMSIFAICCRQRGRVVKTAVIDSERDRHGFGSKSTCVILSCS